jgi:hypothetical protein
MSVRASGRRRRSWGLGRNDRHLPGAPGTRPSPCSSDSCGSVGSRLKPLATAGFSGGSASHTERLGSAGEASPAAGKVARCLELPRSSAAVGASWPQRETQAAGRGRLWAQDRLSLHEERDRGGRVQLGGPSGLGAHVNNSQSTTRERGYVDAQLLTPRPRARSPFLV